MLEILSETKDPTKVQPHLKKCFEGIAKLKFSDGEDGHEEHDILAMISEEKEEVPLKDIISVQQANGAVEKWLLQVEAAMFDNIAHITGEGIKSYGAKPRTSGCSTGRYGRPRRHGGVLDEAGHRGHLRRYPRGGQIRERGAPAIS